MLVVFFISLFFLPYETVIYIEITTPRPVWNSRVISPSLLVKNGMIKVDRWWPFLGSQYFLSRLSCSIWRRERKERKSTKDSLPTRLIGPPKLLFSVVNFSPFLNFKPPPFLELLIEEGRLCINRSISRANSSFSVPFDGRWICLLRDITGRLLLLLVWPRQPDATTCNGICVPYCRCNVVSHAETATCISRTATWKADPRCCADRMGWVRVKCQSSSSRLQWGVECFLW